MMPKIAYEPQNLSEREVLKRILIQGTLRATSPVRPKLVRTKEGWTYKTVEDGFQAHAAYVWRHVVFCVSPNPCHHHMPVTASFYLASYDDEKQALDDLVDRIINSIPKTEWHGVARWSRLL